LKLAAVLGPNRSLTHLHLVSNGFGEEGAAALAHALSLNTTLTVLRIDRNCIGNTGATAFAQVLLRLNSTLTHLYLVDAGIGDAGATELAQILPVNRTLLGLCLAQNRIADEGGQAFVNALCPRHHPRLVLLDLQGNNLGAAVKVELRDILKDILL
jgi:Ran GTPase-activating protein (RanGAP) involved in mRNA processing and transport